ncbi:SGNH hydrolase domain-containing protein [Streptomyces sp. NPDC007205]|uniref:SGNH hydrolase domain-containing protein n=1 Tax=Streptomyces sp. NPDC007205 TaxID=3154316 RepID=UPI00340E948D
MKLNRFRLGIALATSGLALWPALASIASATPVEGHLPGASAARIGIHAEPPLGAAHVTPLAARKKVLSVGDSWAVHMETGMRAASPGTIVYGNGRGGCGIRFTADNEGSTCNQWPTLWPQLMDKYHPDAVLLMVAQWDSQPRKVTWDAPPRDLTDPDQRERFTQNLNRAVDILSARNTPVYVMNAPRIDASARVADDLIENVARAHANVHVLNLRDQLCDANACPSPIHGIPVYDRTWHTTHGAETRLGAWILNQMFQPRYQS